MKQAKRVTGVFRAVLGLTLMLAFALLPVTAQGGTVEHEHDGVSFRPWEGEDAEYTLPYSGNYYLTDDVTLYAPHEIDSDTLKLCLNGHTVTYAANDGEYTDPALCVSGSASLAIYDCQGNGAIEAQSVGSKSGKYGDLTYSDPVVITHESEGTVTLHGGALSAVPAEGYEDTLFSKGIYSLKPAGGESYGRITIAGGSVTASDAVYTLHAAVEISGGTVNGLVDPEGGLTMSGGTVNGRVTLDTNTTSAISSGSIEELWLSGYGSPSVDVCGDVRITKGITFSGGGCMCYLSGSPIIDSISYNSSSNSTPWTEAAADAPLLLRHSTTANALYGGAALKIYATGDFAGQYFVQGVDSALSGKAYLYNDPEAQTAYGLAYDADNTALKAAVAYTITYKDKGGEDFSGTHGANYPVIHIYGMDTALVSPTKTGYTFGGWFTTSDCTGRPLTTLAATEYSENITLYAKWTAQPVVADDDEVYPPVITPAANGQVSVSPQFPEHGNTVTVSITPDAGFTVDTITLKDAAGNEVPFSGPVNGKLSFTQPNRTVTVTVSFKSPVLLPFIDVSPSDWFYDDVAFAYEQGLLQGVGDKVFGPYLTTTRGMIVASLYRLEGYFALSGSCPFDDVAPGSYYQPAITWAAANRIVEGYGTAKFGPDDQITREQLAAILYRYAQYKGYETSSAPGLAAYADAARISAYAVPALQWACGCGLIQGAEGMLTPQANAQRCQAAALIRRFCETVAE